MRLNESSLSRLWRHNEKYECAALTAYRKGADCGAGKPYVNKDNQKRNKNLKAKLMSRDYGITVLKGVYPEGGKTAKEISFFVVNQNEEKGFFDWIAMIGERFEQDSVLMVPKGAINNDAKAYLYGTNHCSNNWLGYHEKEVFSHGKLGYNSPIYTSIVNNRPFLFEDVSSSQEIMPASGFGRWHLRILAEQDWKDMK